MSSAYIPDENMPRERSESSLFFCAARALTSYRLVGKMKAEP